MTLAYLGDSGIVLLGGDERFQYDDAGVRWQWGGDDPWTPGPAPRTITGDNANDHGSWDATRFYGPRRYALEGLAHASDHTALHAAKQRLMTAVGLAFFQLRCVEPGFDRVGQFRRDGDVSWKELTHSIARFSVPLWAGDPRAYSVDTHTASTGFPSTVGGLAWPTTWPAIWDGVTTSGDLSVSNTGTETAWPTYRIDGPVTDPVILNADTGQAMRFAITLSPGEWLTVDTGTHQVLGNGDPAASRRNTFHGDWFGLPPGPSTIRFTGSSGAGSTLSAFWRDTWI